MSKKITYHYRPPPYPFFFWFGLFDNLIQCKWIFLDFDKESKSKKDLFFFFGGGGGGGVVAGGGEHNVQMFQMALLVFKEYKCAKLFWNTCLNTE